LPGQRFSPDTVLHGLLLGGGVAIAEADVFFDLADELAVEAASGEQELGLGLHLQLADALAGDADGLPDFIQRHLGPQHKYLPIARHEGGQDLLHEFALLVDLGLRVRALLPAVGDDAGEGEVAVAGTPGLSSSTARPNSAWTWWPFRARVFRFWRLVSCQWTGMRMRRLVVWR
jgi:hypothetical protein